jgi:calcineurin-like phosphoesterase family protein
MNYFLADPHLGHINVLKFDNRPFDSIGAHDNAIIQNWNGRVNEDDDVYLLGDISWHTVPNTCMIYQLLKGKKHWIVGNHDKKYLKDQKLRECFVEITDYKELNAEEGLIVLCHYPIPCFNKHYYHQYHFYGHVHNSFEWEMMEQIRNDMVVKFDKPCNMINVGVMMPYMDYTPKTFDEIVSGYNEYKDKLGKFVRCSK